MTGANFVVFEKSCVNGKNTSEVFKYLRINSRLKGGKIRWNFGKFLIDRNGNVVQYYGSSTYPLAMVENIDRII